MKMLVVYILIYLVLFQGEIQVVSHHSINKYANQKDFSLKVNFLPRPKH